MDNFNINPSPSEMKERDEVLAKSYKSLIYFGRAFLPNDFLKKSRSPAFHYDVADKLITSKPGSRSCIIMPRGFGKSILSKAAIMHKLVFAQDDEQHFIAWVSEEQSQSIDHLKYLRNHFEMNKRLRYDFESELNTKTPERRADIKKWIVSTVYPALEETPGREGWIWLAGTIVHFDSFLQAVVDGNKKAQEEGRTYPWKVTFKRAIEDGKSIWKDQFSLKKLAAKKREFIEAGLVNKFAQEYMNDARDISNAAFKIDRIQYFNGKVETRNKFNYLIDGEDAIPVNIYLGVDLAATASETSDFQVILVMAIDSNNNRYVLEYFRERIPTFDVPKEIIRLANKYTPVRRVTIETVAAQEMVRDMVTRMSASEKRLMPGIFKGVKPPARIKKQDRLETSLGVIVNSKKLYIRREMTELVDEFFEHPKPRNDDVMDALYYADYFAKAPKSTRTKRESLLNEEASPVRRMKKKAYNWMTGSRA